jgi:hypothetical protein
VLLLCGVAAQEQHTNDLFRGPQAPNPPLRGGLY